MQIICKFAINTFLRYSINNKGVTKLYETFPLFMQFYPIKTDLAVIDTPDKIYWFEYTLANRASRTALMFGIDSATGANGGDPEKIRTVGDAIAYLEKHV